tara:strand:- start:6716 stop:7123 length:408 start_codon:yes stop_codon:yes gene_type:complete
MFCLKNFNIFGCFTKCCETNKYSHQVPPESPPSQNTQLTIFIDNKRINTMIQSYSKENEIYNPFIVENDEENNKENNEELLKEECMICLEEKYINKCVKTNCCNCVLHSECFENWCVIHNKIICPLCHKVHNNLP